MDLAPAKPRLTSLLDNDLLARVERLSIHSTQRFTNRGRGEHLSRKGGSSNEFADYRNYTEGDDVRFIDWNVFSRHRRPYLKLYRHEEEMHVVLLIDASTSMAFADKLTRAKQVAAAMGVMGLFNTERVSVYAFNHDDAPPLQHKPGTGRGRMRELLGFVESIEGGGAAPLEVGIESVLRRHRGRGIVVLLSDFLTFGDLPRAFNLLYSSGLEILALQILSPGEIDPELTGDVRLVDAESQATLDITSAGDLIRIYHEYRRAFQQKLESHCTQRGGRFLSISSADPIAFVLLDLFRRKGWVR